MHLLLSAVAEGIGVFAEPEFEQIELTESHAFLILGSDGIWEFLPSQRAVDIVARCSDPQEAARLLVSSAYKTWLQKETRTDDISVVLVYFDFPAVVVEDRPRALLSPDESNG